VENVAMPKELKCTHCGSLNHNANHCCILHPKRRLALEKEKAIEIKIAELEK